MRILHIGYLFTIGGAENMLVDIINRQIKFADIGLCIINDKLNYSLLDSLDNKVSKLLIKRKEGNRNILKILRLYKEIYNFKPDVIHVHQDIIAQVLRFIRIPLVLTVHDVGINLKCLERYKAICAISKAVQNDIENGFNNKSTLIYNGIDFNLIKSRDFKPLDGKNFRIIQVSRLIHEKKGQDILIKAVSLLKQDFPDINISLDFIGCGDSKEYLQRLCDEYKVNDSVRFLGEKDRSFIYDNLYKYDLLVQPSRYEGFGLTVIEGLAAKLPVLSSKNDGPEEILKNGTYGFLFENGDVQDCYIQLKNIYLQYNSLMPMTEHSYLYAKENYDIDKTVQQYFEIYESVLAK